MPAIVLNVPELDLQLDRAASSVSGSATLGGQLLINADIAFPRDPSQSAFQSSWVSAPLNSNGTFHVGFSEFKSPFGDRFNPISWVPGTVVRATYRLAEGHEVLRSRLIPLLNAPVGGSLVCGLADPATAIHVSVQSGLAESKATVDTTADSAGRYRAFLRDASGRPVSTTYGDKVTAAVQGYNLNVDIPTLDTQVDWNAADVTGGINLATLVSGHATPNRRLRIAWPLSTVDPCFTTISLAYSMPPEYEAIYTQPDGLGNYSSLVSHVSTGVGLEISSITSDMQRIYKHVYRSRYRVFVHSNRVTGQINANDIVDINLSDASGLIRGTANVVADDLGAFSASIVRVGGKEASINSGDTILVTAGGTTTSILVEPIDFDFDTRSGLAVTGPSNRDLNLMLMLNNGRRLNFNAETGANGRYSLRPSDIPLDNGWTLADIRTLSVSLTTGDGHEIVAKGAIGGSIHPGSLLYLPWSNKARH
jgi:hypothetical protein